MDLGRMGDQLFATVAAFGFDAEISHSMSSGQAPFSGTVGYLWQTLRHLPRFRPPRVCLQGEFGLIEQEVLLVATANTRRYGGGLCIAPQADPRDGYFDLCIVDPVPFHTVLPMLPRLFWGGHVGHPAVRLERTAWLRLETEEPCLLHADGEYLGQTPAALEISPAALRVVLPRPARALA
jgi:diacylglycerol kinase (ATP)